MAAPNIDHGTTRHPIQDAWQCALCADRIPAAVEQRILVAVRKAARS